LSFTSAIPRTLLLVVLLAVSSCGGQPGEPSDVTLTITAISPVAGSSSGGTRVTITGTNFANGATVMIGGIAAEEVTITGSTTITAVTGARAAGLVDIVVTVGGTSAQLGGAFTYVAPPAGLNAAPTIGSIVARGSRPNQPARFADLGEAIVVTADVADPETAASLLEYEWAAPAGTFDGQGATVSWRAPAAFQTPGAVALTLDVIERFTAPGPGGLLIQHEHRVRSSVTVWVHDSIREVGEMARRFLLRYSDSSVSPAVVVEDFLPACRGRQEEFDQVVEDREEATITAYEIGQPQVTINFGGRCAFRSRAADACASMSVDWRDVEKDTGVPRHTWGVEHITALYRDSRWGLCDADIDGRHERNGLTIQLVDR
jgi:hypothetical protein